MVSTWKRRGWGGEVRSKLLPWWSSPPKMDMAAAWKEGGSAASLQMPASTRAHL
jgi:hypothetical protein